jgi:hypothetical protein
MKTEPSGEISDALPRHPSPVVDVRPDVEANGEPFLRILAVAQETAPGQDFIVVSPFELRAVYPVLVARGFCYQTEYMGAGEWLTRFCRLRAAACQCASSAGDASK